MQSPDRAIRTLDRLVREGSVAGAGLVVWKQGDIVIEHYAGEAAPRLDAGPGVLWPMASISKVYTAALVMRLVEDGVVTLSTPVHFVLPQFAGDRREEVRIRHLLTHTAGLIYESPEMEARLKARTPMSELVAEALRSPLLFAPGTELRYADYNYLVAGHVADVVTGTPFAALVREQVLEPANLRQTFLPPRRDDYGRTAIIRGVLAEGTDGAMYNSAYARDLAHPAFGVWATTADLARFGSMFLAGGPRFLSPPSVRAMTTDQTGQVPGTHPSMKGYAADARIPWAIGFALQTERVPGLYSDLASVQTFGHGGASGCLLVCDPACGVAVALTTNAHLRMGREPWTRRMQSVVNAALADVSQL
ncbi:MAG TPA: serine hydrolase domain-containing protein [Vicinamibacterales bacterium]|nr:serine hydrolase domain-containing protein [Vicinamibacterales bacterium]